MNRLRQAILSTAAALALAAVAPAGADWLVTRDGAMVETKGPWQVEGRRVLFTQPNGTLASLRTEEVDLDRSASETARAQAAAAAPPAEPPKREPVLRLTEKDIPPARELEVEEAAAGAPASSLEVVSWEKVDNPSGEGVEIFGTLRNNGADAISGPRLLVMIYGEDGGLLATTDGSINAAAVPPGRTANFRAAFPGVPDFASVRFDVQGSRYDTRPPEAGEGEEGAVEATEEPTAPAEPEAPLEEEPPPSE